MGTHSGQTRHTVAKWNACDHGAVLSHPSENVRSCICTFTGLKAECKQEQAYSSKMKRTAAPRGRHATTSAVYMHPTRDVSDSTEPKAETQTKRIENISNST